VDTELYKAESMYEVISDDLNNKNQRGKNAHIGETSLSYSAGWNWLEAKRP
jgi:hypothetical protein